MRVLDGDVAALRSEYLFALAHVCHVPPEATWDLMVHDFANLIQGIESYVESSQPQG